jgi:hypothetical protein
MPSSLAVAVVRTRVDPITGAVAGFSDVRKDSAKATPPATIA